MGERGARGSRNRNVFKGSVLVSILLESYPRRFRSRAAAVRWGRRLQRAGHITSVFGARPFEDSAQLYMWQDDDAVRRHGLAMTSSQRAATSPVPAGVPDSAWRSERGEGAGGFEGEDGGGGHERLDARLIADLKHKVLNRSEVYNIVTSYNTFFRELQQDFGDKADRQSERVSHRHHYQLEDHRQHQSQVHRTHQYAQQQQHPEQFHRQEGEPQLQPLSQQQQHPEQFRHLQGEADDGFRRRWVQARGQRVAEGYVSSAANSEQVYSNEIYQNPWGIKGEQGGSTDSSLDTQTYFRTRDRNISRAPQPTMAAAGPPHVQPGQSHDRPAAPDHRPPHDGSAPLSDRVKGAERPEGRARSYEDVTCLQTNYPEDSIKPYATSVASRDVTAGGGVVIGSGVAAVESGGAVAARCRWSQEGGVYSFSDNEKQLIEEMRRMKQEHQHVLRTYEGRINKLMAKMHELRDIAEMLENSSSKSSPYGLLPARATILSILASGTKLEENEKKTVVSAGGQADVPPPLPPRPGRGGRVYPNKPIVHPRVRMRTLAWTRIILGDSGQEEKQNTLWCGMQEPQLDTDQIEKLYACPPDPSADDVTLLDDICAMRGRPKHQLLAMFDTERSQRLLAEMRNLRCTLADVIGAITSLDTGSLHQDSFAELLELLNSPRDLDKILHHVKRKGPGQLDSPEYLVFELSKLDHFRERLEFLRFKNKLLINLFEIDQQLRELTTACDELTNNPALRNVLETVLAVGNYLNGGSDRGQADGFRLDILNKLKEFVDRPKRGNLLELIMRSYCLRYERGLEPVCPTRFRLPEPSNMRHAAQVSFDEIQKALRDLREELSQVRDRLEILYSRESSALIIALRVASENFLTSAVEILAEEKRMLEDTKGHFWKTTTYFCHNNRQSTPQEFFQIWATFLHDCKYYWKLAHRNIARDKFENDFSTKCQLSSSSLPGFTNLKNKMIRTVATLRGDQDMLASKAQQLQHINRWIESIGRYTQELRPEDTAHAHDHYDLEPASHVTPSTPGQHERQHHADQRQWPPADRGGPADRPPSPKPIVATPPNVHKPQPVVHAGLLPAASYTSAFPVAAASSEGLDYANSHHQQQRQPHSDTDTLDDDYECLNKAVVATPHGADPALEGVEGASRRELDDASRKTGNFSLKALLKRDPRHGGSTDGLATPTGPSQQHAPRASSAATPFNKLRSTVTQRLSGGSSSAKNVRTPGSDASVKTSASEVPRKPPRAHADSEFAPSHQILFHSSQQLPDGDPRRVSLDTDERCGRAQRPSQVRAARYTDRGGHDSATPAASSASRRDVSPSKHEAGSRGEAARARGGSRERGAQHRSTDGAPAVCGEGQSGAAGEQLSPHKSSRARTRAPIALGSNLSISDAYDRRDSSRPLQQPLPFSGSNSNVAGPNENAGNPAASGPVPQLPSTVDSKRVKAQAVPVYKAKLIPNYENQAKLDPRLQHAVRGQAQPLLQPHVPQTSASSDLYRQELQRKSEMYLGMNLPPAAHHGPPLADLAPTVTATTAHLHGGGGEEELTATYVNDPRPPAQLSASAGNLADTTDGAVYVNECAVRGGQSEQKKLSDAFFSSTDNTGSNRNLSSVASGKKGDFRGRGGRGREPSRERSVERAAREASEAAPRVSTLIDRWEKQTADEPVSEGQDKAPSMTSTPVTRRKNPPACDEWTGGGRRPDREGARAGVSRPVTSQPARYEDQMAGTVRGLTSGASHSANLAPNGRSRGQKTPLRQQLGDDRQLNFTPHHNFQQQALHSQAYSNLQQDQHQASNQHQYFPQHAYPSSNTYPPRGSHPPARQPNDSSTVDIPSSYGQQQWMPGKAGGSGGGGDCDGGEKPSDRSRPVPLPRHNIPGAMAVVKPTVMHQGPLTFMEI